MGSNIKGFYFRGVRRLVIHSFSQLVGQSVSESVIQLPGWCGGWVGYGVEGCVPPPRREHRPRGVEHLQRAQRHEPVELRGRADEGRGGGGGG